MTIEEERELFDKWYGKKPRGWFEAVRYNTAWRAWQASANREGYKLVPVEPTDIEIESIKEKHWDMRGCQLCKSDYIDLYKAMIEAQEPAND